VFSVLSSVVASELEQVASDAIRTAFHPTTPGFSGLIDRFLADREQLLKGPYVSVAQCPFIRALGVTGSRRSRCSNVAYTATRGFTRFARELTVVRPRECPRDVKL
jgi:hypothetical protein